MAQTYENDKFLHLEFRLLEVQIIYQFQPGSFTNFQVKQIRFGVWNVLKR